MHPFEDLDRGCDGLDHNPGGGPALGAVALEGSAAEFVPFDHAVGAALHGVAAPA